MKGNAIVLGVLAGIVGGFSSTAHAYLPTDFRVAASSAPAIVIGKVSKGREGMRILNVERVIRGQSGTQIQFNPKIGVNFFGEMSIGSSYIVLVSTDGKAFRTENACGTINALKIEDGSVIYAQDYDLKIPGRPAWAKIPLVEFENDFQLEEK